MSGLRLFFTGGRIAYRALFNWRSPAVFIPTMLAAPVFQILFFAFLGRYSGVADDRYFVVGNAVGASAMAGVFGMVMVIANERQFGTISALLATPASRLALFQGRTLLPIACGLLVSAVGLGAGWLLLDVQLEPATLPALTMATAIAAASCAAFGVALGAVCLRANDIWVGSNLAYALVLLLCGMNVPVEQLPSWLAAVGRALPLTHGIDAARQLAAGAGLADVADALGLEALIGAGYATLGYVLLRLIEAENRKRATLDRP
jgi:ABC-2 type transport system permease protein